MHPNDSGPIYRETLMGRLPVEPWNTWSNLVFLFVVIFWALRAYREPRTHLFLAGALPVLFIGFVGGTVFHGTRSHEVWLLMDWVPIVLLCTACMVLFARRAGLAWPWLLVLFLLPFAARYFLLRSGLPRTFVMNGGYAAMGIMVPAAQSFRTLAVDGGLCSAFCDGRHLPQPRLPRSTVLDADGYALALACTWCPGRSLPHGLYLAR